MNGIINFKNHYAMKKNYYVYYGTEENAYEIEKSGNYTKEEAIAMAKKCYLDEFLTSQEEIQNIVSKLEDGVVFVDDYKGYNMFVGIAAKGKLAPLRNKLLELRKEFIAYF